MLYKKIRSKKRGFIVSFEIPQDVYNEWNTQTKGQDLESAWQQTFAAYSKAHPELSNEFNRRKLILMETNYLLIVLIRLWKV